MAKQCVNSCCGCCTLETGGYIIGWLNIIFGILGLIGSILIVVFAALELKRPELGPVYYAALITLIVIFSIYILFTLLYTIAGILLVIGTKNRQHVLMIPMLVLMLIGVVISFINLITGVSAGTIVVSVTVALLQVYFLVCIYSLYAMVKNENSGKPVYG